MEETEPETGTLPEADAEAMPEAEADTLPAVYDYRQEGHAPRIGNQGNLGTCWAFAFFRGSYDHAQSFSAGSG